MPLILPIPQVEINPNDPKYSPTKKRKKSDNYQQDRDMLHNFFMISKDENENNYIKNLFLTKCLSNKHQAYIYDALRINNKALTFNTMDEYIGFLSKIIDKTQSHHLEDNIPGDLDNFLKSPEIAEKLDKTSTLEEINRRLYKLEAGINGTADNVEKLVLKVHEGNCASEGKERKIDVTPPKGHLGSMFEQAVESNKHYTHDGIKPKGKATDTIHGPEEETQDQSISNDQNKNHDFILAMCLTLLALSCVMLYWVPIKLLLVKIIPLPQLSSFLMSTTGNAISKILFGLVVLLPMMLLSYQNNNSAPLTVDITKYPDFDGTTVDTGEAFDIVPEKKAKNNEKDDNDKIGNTP